MLVYFSLHLLSKGDPQDALWQDERFHFWSKFQLTVYELHSIFVYCQWRHIIPRIFKASQWLSQDRRVSREYDRFSSSIRPPDLDYQRFLMHPGTSRRTTNSGRNRFVPRTYRQ